MATGNAMGNVPRNVKGNIQVNRPNNHLSNANLVHANQKANNQKPVNQPVNQGANAEKEREKEREEEWRRFRKIYAFFILMLVLYECRLDRKNAEISNVQSVIQERFTKENYMSSFDRVIKMISPVIIDNKGLRNGDGNFQIKIKMAMTKMYRVGGFLELYNKLCEGDPTVRENKVFFMTFMDLIHFDDRAKSPHPGLSLSYIISMGSQVPPPVQVQSSSPSPSNGANSGSLFGSVIGGIREAINKGSSMVNAVQLPGDTLTDEEKIALAPIGEKLRNIAAYFTTNQLYQSIATNAEPTVVPSVVPAVVPIPQANAVVPVPQTNAVVPVPPTNAVVPVPPTNTVTPVPQINTVTPVPHANVPVTVPSIPQTTVGGGKKGGGKKRGSKSGYGMKPNSSKNRLQLNSASTSSSGKRLSLNTLWRLHP